MKIFQTKNGFMYKDISNLQDQFGVLNIPELYAVETPDYVFEGWGYDESAEGDARFIQPEAPAGWLYDEATGTFYQEGTPKPGTAPTADERLAALEAALLAVLGGADDV